MSLAYATKDQMKVWKSTSKKTKDDPDRPTQRVMFVVSKAEVGYDAALMASDGYQLVKRSIQTEDGAKSVKWAIPGDAIEKAEKAMQQGDRAYFDEGKITIREIKIDERTGFEDTRITAVIPYVEQMDMFMDLETPMQKTANSKHPEKIVTLDAKVLKKVVEQLKSGDARVFVTVRMRGELDGVLLTAFEGIHDEAITAVVMPIRT